MPKRPEARIKKRRLPSGAVQYYTRFKGRFWSLGSDEQEAQRLLGELMSGRSPAHQRSGPTVPPVPSDAPDASPAISELAQRYTDHASLEYRGSSEADAVRVTMERLAASCGALRATEFRIPQLEAFRDELVGRGLVRTTVNQCIGRVKRMLDWAAEKELVHPDVASRARRLKALKPHKSHAREPRDRQPVPWECVEPVLPHVTREVRALILLQWYTGARSGEVLNLRPCDIDRSRENVWSAKIEKHKTAYRGHRRTLHFGPQAQVVLREFLDRVPRPSQSEPLFSPQRADRERAIRRRALRKSKVQPSQAARRSKPVGENQRAKRAAYDRCSYARAIAYGIQKTNAMRFGAVLQEVLPTICTSGVTPWMAGALRSLPTPASTEEPGAFRERLATQLCNMLGSAGIEATVSPKTFRARLREALGRVEMIPHWHPHLLRHAAATRIEAATRNLESARVVLGHRSARVTDGYVRRDDKEAADVMAKLG